VWEIRVGVCCTKSQADELVDRIQRVLCPDPDHSPPCPVPWSTALRPLDSEEAAADYPELIDQARIERGGQ
jgi:hypothetical protein